MRHRRQSSPDTRNESKKLNGHDHSVPHVDVNGHGKEDGHKDAHQHAHSHGGLFHAHDHSHSKEGAQLVVEALKGGGDRGSRITLIGLGSNVALTASKGVAGWLLNSASLLADAGHSLSDLLGDFVVLAAWSTSRKAPTSEYPYGYGKFETMGTTAVALLLVGGALAIGYHSYYLLLTAIEPYMSSMSTSAAAEVLKPVIEASQTAVLKDVHTHALDPNAAWFALASVVTKEYMYRITKRVADDEGSSVLLANAYHHRSDAYSSAVALVAILGTWFGIPALDPIGGLGVSVLIFYQGVSLLLTAFRELTDAGVSAVQRDDLTGLLAPLISTQAPHQLLAIRNVRAVRSGALLFVDLTADVPAAMTMKEAHEVERTIRECLMKERKEVQEVRVHLHAEGVEDEDGQNERPC